MREMGNFIINMINEYMKAAEHHQVVSNISILLNNYYSTEHLLKDLKNSYWNLLSFAKSTQNSFESG